VRPTRLVVGSVLTAALALVALPGLAGSRVPSPIEPVPASVFQTLDIRADVARSTTSIGGLDDAHASEGRIDALSSIAEPGAAANPIPTGRPAASQQDASASSTNKTPQLTSLSSIHKTPRYTLTGYATFYDNGTTAMRLPRGTVVLICGGGGCVKRVVNDYGPQKPSRVVDMYRPDFFAICGCGWFAGSTKVTVYVY
jgi:hypothetical protein